MLTDSDYIKYIGFTAILYFLIKAFIGDKVDNTQVITLVVLVIVIFIFISSSKFKCINNIEHYQITNPPIIDSVYPQISNTNTHTTLPDDIKIQKLTNRSYVNADLELLKTLGNVDPQSYNAVSNNEINAQKQISNQFTNEMVYTKTNPLNTIPLGSQVYGYTYLPPENWFRGYDKPPVCVTERPALVCPTPDPKLTGLMEFDNSNNVINGADMNLQYIQNKINKTEN